MERTTLPLEEIWDQLSMGESQKFKVQKVLLLDRYKKRYSKDSNPRICDTKSVLQTDPICLVQNGIYCELTDMDTGRRMSVFTNKLRKVSLRRKPKPRYTTIFCVLIVLLFLTNICCVCFPVNPASNSLANIDTVPKDLDFPAGNWKPVEASFANFHLSYNIFVPSNAKNHCKDAELFVFIATRTNSFDIRQIIRSTWASPENIGQKTVVKFAIGQPKHQNTIQDLFQEQETFEDLILYDYQDEYRQLHIKMHAAFNWQQNVCPNVKLVFRTDDDSAVDLPRLRYWIDKEMSVAQKNNPAILFGVMKWNDHYISRDPNNKWYVSEKDFPDTAFPPYASGWATLYTSEAIKAMLQHTHEVNALSVEDVLYSGILAEKAGVRKIDASKHFMNRAKIPIECDDKKVPFVTAVCCFGLQDMVKVYEKIKNVQCPRDDYPNTH